MRVPKKTVDPDVRTRPYLRSLQLKPDILTIAHSVSSDFTVMEPAAGRNGFLDGLSALKLSSILTLCVALPVPHLPPDKKLTRGPS